MRSLDPGGRVGTFAGFREGAFLLLEGARLLHGERRLWWLALVPMAFALLLVAASTSLFWLRIDSIHVFWVEFLPVLEVGGWWSWIWIGPAKFLVWLIGWGAVIACFALSLVASLLVANLASAPFLDRLSQRVETIQTGEPPDTGAAGPGQWIVDAIRSFGAELKRLLFLTGIWIALTVLGFLVPGAHLMTTPAIVAITIVFLPLDYAGFALDRRGLSFAQRREWLLGNRSLVVGFGMVAFVTCMIPGVNLVILPAQIAAGTLLVVRRSPTA